MLFEQNTLVPWIQAAGGLQLLIAAANFVLPRILNYRSHLSSLPPILRQIFVVHSVYIVITLLIFSGLCLFFASDLSGASALGRFLSGSLAFFWGLRVWIQVRYYDRETKRAHPIGNLFFTLAFLYLAMIFLIATIGGLKWL